MRPGRTNRGQRGNLPARGPKDKPPEEPRGRVRRVDGERPGRLYARGPPAGYRGRARGEYAPVRGDGGSGGRLEAVAVHSHSEPCVGRARAARSAEPANLGCDINVAYNKSY